jgi:RNA polymerase sigma-70 factor (ECF subfamily)
MQDDLLQRFLVSRSRADLEALVRGEHAWLLAIAQHVAHDPGLAEDAVQEVFVKLIESPPATSAVQTSRGWLAACVIGAARTLLRGKTRREHRERVASRPEVLGDERDDIAHDTEPDLVRAAVFALPDAHRECVELRYFAGLSADEIGRTLGCARRTVDERLASARESLRRRLAPRAFALIAAGIQHETAVPRVTASREFIGRLERLLEHPSLITRTTAAGASAMFTWLAAAIVVSVGAFAVWSETRRATSSSETIAAQSPASRRDESRSDSTEIASAPADARVAVPSSGGALVQPQGRPSADLRVHVVDGSGAHVHAGELRFEPADLGASAALLSLSQRDDLARFAELLDPIPLAGRNPLEVRGLPNELVGQSFRANAVVPGYGTPEPATFEVTDHGLSEVTLVVRAPRTIAISVEDAATHRAIANATVLSTTELERRDIEAAKALREHAPGAATSDALGHCTLDRLGAGEHDIEVHAAGHASTSVKLAAEANHLEIALNVVSQFASITVEVTAPNNVPVEGLPVICRQVGREFDRRASTDAKGGCRFAELEPGSWTVMLDSIPYAELRSKNKWKGANECVGTPLELTAGDDERVHLGFLSGTAAWAIELVDAHGRPGGELEVRLSGPVQRTGTTGKRGRVLFEYLPAGKWSIEVNGWTGNEQELADASMRTDRVELGTAHIRGRVKFAGTGAPAKGASVIASGDVFAMCRCDENGEFQLENAPKGTFVVGAGVAGYTSSEATVVVKDGDPPPIELTLVR